MTWIALLLALFVSPMPIAAPARLAEQADVALEALVEAGFQGSVLLACGRDVIYRRDVGVDAAGGALRYWVASISKSLTAIAVLRRVDSGELSLEDPLSRFFPSAPDDKAVITLFQLLTHQSGLPQAYAAEGIADLDDAAGAVFRQALSFAPGTGFQYANDNYSLLGMVLERSTGRPYRAIMADTLSHPLGIEPIAFWPDPVRADEVVPPLMSPPPSTAATNDWGFLGGHGARLSVDELHAIAVALETGALLSPGGMAALYGPHRHTSGGTGVGMGWFRETDAAGRGLRWTRGYDTSGANAVLYLFDGSDALLIAASNAGPAEGDGPGWSRSARDALLPLLAPLEGPGPCDDD